MCSLQTSLQEPVSYTEDYFVESLLEQGSSAVNEDSLSITADVFGVYDGSTSLVSCKYSGSTGGRIAADLAAETFARGKGTLAMRATVANRAIWQKMEQEGVDRSLGENLWATSLAVIKIHRNSIEWCALGDCRLLFIYGDGSYRQINRVEDHDRQTLALMESLGGLSTSRKHPRMRQQIIEVRRRMNIDYGVLTGEERALGFLQTGLEPRAGIVDMLLFSDGLLLPGEGQSGLGKMVKAYQNGGLAALREDVRSWQNSDPDCISWPRFKKHDDASAISLKILSNIDC
ncbi:protein phosphatase 2C domain-containing protein [Desulfotalea psychrophila]|uniref:PPM-type phosphatase domain-containing protein n=1 Tax=Desulfotalea psychrophila (strain LSv54 / DSM 12343) TaxID=177439 RepID=Q6AS14_DESPS|nr:protein phosphatase 2C domain-containing protein [Desulfotalea psychrophila]CAG34861.1 hypothetical protein DP0132 [Desulfotalea psychrophila LSv54]